MTSSKTNGNYDKVMEDVNKALPQTMKNGIYTRIADDLTRVNDMLNGEKAEEYGNPRVMFQNISKRWFGCDDAEVDVAIMMAELKIERIKYDHSKEDSYLDAIAYLTMALAFMQEGERDHGLHVHRNAAILSETPTGMTVQEPRRMNYRNE
mgnify:CR=1 FL=1